MNFQLRSLATSLRPKSRLSDSDDGAPELRPKTKPTSGWSHAWQACRRKAAHLNLRPRRFSASSTYFSSSSKRSSRDSTPSSLASAASIAKPIPGVPCEARPLPPVAGTPSATAAFHAETPLDPEAAAGEVVYRSAALQAAQSRLVEAETKGPGRPTERPLESKGAKPPGPVLPLTPTLASITSDYDIPAVDDGSCYGSFNSDRRLVVESYLELQAETGRSFIDRW